MTDLLARPSKGNQRCYRCGEWIFVGELYVHPPAWPWGVCTWQSAHVDCYKERP